jgi:hypothetical protein
MEIMSPFLIQQAFSPHGSEVALGLAIAAAAMHFIFFLCIWHDAGKLQTLGRSSLVLPPLIWGLSALVFGLIAVVIYWVFHYSSFRGKDI